MATTITGKLNKPANVFQAGESTGFGIRLGVKYRDPKTKEDAWCNYSAVIFAKSAGQIQFYQNALIEGSIVEVSAEQLKVDSFQGDNGAILSIDMLNARLGIEARLLWLLLRPSLSGKILLLCQFHHNDQLNQIYQLNYLNLPDDNTR